MTPREFWDHKILGWERAKYRAPSGPVQRWFDPNRGVRFRGEWAADQLAGCVADKVVLELGCGSARLLPRLLDAGCRRYIGVDVSKSAVDAAQQRAVSLRATPKVELLVGDVREVDVPAADIVFSLGMLDWLSPSEITAVLSQCHRARYLHSFSEKTRSFERALHRLYVLALYGHRDIAYTPRYYSADTIKDAFVAAGLRGPEFFRDPKLRFGCMALGLDQAEAMG